MLRSCFCILYLAVYIMQSSSAGFQNSNIKNISPNWHQTQTQQAYQHPLQKDTIVIQSKQQRNLDPNMQFYQNTNQQQQQNETQRKENIISSLNQVTEKMYSSEIPVQASIVSENKVEKLSLDVENKIEEHRLSLTNFDKIQAIVLKKQGQRHDEQNEYGNHEEKGFIDSVLNFFKGIYDVSGPAQPNLDPVTKLDNNANNTQSQMYNQIKGVSSLQIQHIATEKYTQKNIQILENNMKGMKRKRRKMQFIISVFLFGVIAIILIKISQGKEKLLQTKYIWRSIGSKLPSNDEGEQI